MTPRQVVLRYGIAYLFWFATLAIAVVCANTVRVTYPILLDYWRWDSSSISVADQVAVIVMALAMVALIVAAEHMYRTAVPAKKLMQPASGIIAVLLATLGVAHATQFYVELQYGMTNPTSVVLFVAELALAIFLWWWRHRLKRRHSQTSASVVL